MPARVPTREMGYVSPYAATYPGQGGFFYGNTFDADEVTAALQWPNNLRIYDQMRREDSQVASIFRAVTMPIRRTAYRIDPSAARTEVVQLVAEDLGLPVLGQDPTATPGRRRGKFSWSRHLQLALLELVYGHMFFEQVYDPAALAATGQARLLKLAPRPPRSISRINVAPDGGLVSIEQYAPASAKVSDPVVLPVRRLVAYVHEMEGSNWLGTSVLRPAYKHWLLKDRNMRVQTQSIERNGMGVPTYTQGPDEDPNNLSAGLAIAARVRAGDNSGVALPHEAKLALQGVTGTLPNVMEPINYHDQQIARAMLAHFLNLGTQTSTATGSYNLGSQFADTFLQSLQTIADQICDVVTQHVIEDLVDLNWGPDEAAPRLVCDDIGSQHDANAQAILMLTQAGAIAPDRALEQYLRMSFGLPMADPSQPMPTAPAATDVPAPEPDPGDDDNQDSSDDSGGEDPS